MRVNRLTDSEKSERPVRRFRVAKEHADMKFAPVPIAMRMRTVQALNTGKSNTNTSEQELTMNTTIRLAPTSTRATGTLNPASAAPGSGALCDLLRLMSVEPGDAPHAPVNADLNVPLRRLHAGDTLFHEGARAEAIYFVRAGTFKAFRTAEDGYEQVLGFSGRTEVLGFDALCMNNHPTAAVALEESSVYVVLMQDIFSLGERCPALDRVVHLAVSVALTRRGELVELMAAVAAEVRLARFLVQMSQRIAISGQSPRRFHLRMSRRDIASHLGVAHETVSRSFSALAGWGCIQVDNREVEILDMEGLKALSRSTRRQVDEPVRASGRRLPVMRPVQDLSLSVVIPRQGRGMTTGCAQPGF